MTNAEFSPPQWSMTKADIKGGGDSGILRSGRRPPCRRWRGGRRVTGPAVESRTPVKPVERHHGGLGGAGRQGLVGRVVASEGMPVETVGGEQRSPVIVEPASIDATARKRYRRCYRQ
ncbi:hypothetical protein OsI_38923 [Oryza sativa Indica Group]|uniref:Uncharacterized protein n=1 Tax=Oryza sativa subsp. indica TaxID=39946 RepID=A2ZM66_ORYSI|nr:hypothetical protein OsI_38923 [Oryza sativa Indica Group]